MKYGWMTGTVPDDFDRLGEEEIFEMFGVNDELRFDRLLIALARVDGMTLITAGRRLVDHGSPVRLV